MCRGGAYTGSVGNMFPTPLAETVDKREQTSLLTLEKKIRKEVHIGMMAEKSDTYRVESVSCHVPFSLLTLWDILKSLFSKCVRGSVGKGILIK